jgi:glycosyltransferase involved in cell wall biosynthesis
VEDGVSGLVVPAENPDRLAEAMLHLARDTALRDRLGHEAAARVDQLRPENVIEIWSRIVGFADGVITRSEGVPTAIR